MSWNYYGFRPYVSVAERRAKAAREMAKLAKKGKTIRPVQLEGRTIVRTFWGKAWCDNLESYMDYANRLPRGRTYVRNGSVVHLDIRAGEIEATVSGSELYKVNISIAPAPKARWKALCHDCSGAIGSLVELLRGRFSDHVMGIITRKETGLFPAPAEIKLKCSCPDWATMCKHVAAVLYGVGARLDQSPELLFALRSVNHEELITQAATATDLAGKTTSAGPELAESEIGAVFGIELDSETAKPAPAPVVPAPAKARRKAKKPAPRKRRAKAKRPASR
ncbi:MAG: SWIM zinc finger family protein [Verrucomicrobia bacterium]|nr:SWIM zinc finger family protein [Verrucomicrobiota bacterium]